MSAPCIPTGTGMNHQITPSPDQVRDFWRYYFAGQALAGLCANPAASAMAREAGASEEEAFAEWASNHADALLARLQQPESEEVQGG